MKSRKQNVHVYIYIYIMYICSEQLAKIILCASLGSAGVLVGALVHAKSGQALWLNMGLGMLSRFGLADEFSKEALSILSRQSSSSYIPVS